MNKKSIALVFIVVVLGLASLYTLRVINHTEEINTIKNLYYIGTISVFQEEFMKLKNELTIDTSSERSTGYESAPGEYGGPEINYYDAVDSKGKNMYT